MFDKILGAKVGSKFRHTEATGYLDGRGFDDIVRDISDIYLFSA